MDRKLVFTANILIKTVGELNNLSFLERLPADFYSTLSGLSDICRINLSKKELSRLLLLIVYIRLISGLEITVASTNKGVFVINMNGSYEKNPKYRMDIEKYEESRREFFDNAFLNTFKEKSLYPDHKEKLLKLVRTNSILSSESLIRNLVIFTHNRPGNLEKVIQEYIENFREFGHENIRIIISDDSDISYSEKYEQIVNKIKEVYPDILHLTPNLKKELVNNLINESTQKFPQYKSEDLTNLISYTFGVNNFPSTIGRNRNFISFYLKNEPFITVDDDASPKVLTYNRNVLSSAVNSLVEGGSTEIGNLSFYIKEPQDTQFIKVDFIGHFENSDMSILKYVKYSGYEDGDLSAYLLNRLGLGEALKVVYSGRNDLPELYKKKIYMNKNRDPNVQGLCCYFPAGFKMKYTMPEKLRIEDSFIGYNYLLETRTSPVWTNIALHHDKSSDLSEVNVEDIIQDFLAIIYYNLYSFMVGQFINGKESIFNRNYPGITIYRPFWDTIHEEIKNVILLLKTGGELASKRKDINSESLLNNMFKELETKIYSVPQNVFESEIEKSVNVNLKNYLAGMRIWQDIENLSFKNG